MNVIFRIQDADGRGPWKPGFSESWVEDRTEREYAELPPWMVEFGPVHRLATKGYAIGCGCRTQEQLRNWIRRSEYLKLKEFGYSSVQLLASRILGESEIQCVFERPEPLRVGATEFDLYG